MSEARPRFSVIVSVYNTKHYLSQCVDSLRRQTLKDIQIILVDDGSTDGSDYLIDQLGREDCRITVIHQENGGVAAARNAGILQAKGDYIGFVDSDDWVEPDMFEGLYSAAEQSKADIAITGVKTVRFGIVSHVLEQSQTVKELSTDDAIFAYRKYCYGAGSSREDRKTVPHYVCNSGFRRAFVEQNHLTFKDALSEDDIFTLQALQSAVRVVLVPGSPYCYRRDDQTSITHSFGPKDLNFYGKNMRIIRRLAELEKAPHQEECLRRSYRHVIDLNRALIHRIVESSLSAKQKMHYIRAVNASRLSRNACSHYSWQYLPFPDVLFYFCQKYQLTVASFAMMSLWVVSARVTRSKTVLQIRAKIRHHATSS